MSGEDVDAVLSIEQQAHRHPWTRAHFNDALATANICKVYLVKDEIVGYAVMKPALDDVDLLDICIAAASQHQGLGTSLLSEMLSLLRSLKFTRVILEVRRTNRAAYSLYCKMGFTEVGLRRGYYPIDSGREDAIVMECKL